ncbi:hypothetical protein BUALT_Bualt14G0008400 [Buddleja alternifolia]|uniref:Uncharacterized protein n=1 Tax=Buddleja alternifolia TaxID=168488 RepID=A0AAV6WM45_9LAMI|nr:hypothetical protein BUALT_Bualt14G0008400 [Buddleja alternifolia]
MQHCEAFKCLSYEALSATCATGHYQDSGWKWWSTETVAIVTGANKGIGFAIVKRLAEVGLTVVLTARDAVRGLNAVQSLKSEGLNNVHFFCLDVSDPNSIQAFATRFQHTFGVVDILINNAAVSFNDIHENSVEEAETVIKTNFYGPKMLTEALLPMFRRSATATRILNISSRLGLLNKLKNPKLKEMLLDEEHLSEKQIEGMVNLFLENVKSGTWKSQGWPQVWTDYAVSKLALNAYSRVLAKRYKGCGISVNCFCPGFTQTSMTGGKGAYTAEAVAEVGARVALLPAEELTTGKFYIETCNTDWIVSAYTEMAGFNALAPKTKNFVVAGGLSAFVFGVYFYTMRAVGGSDELQVAIDKFEDQKRQTEPEATLAPKA